MKYNVSSTALATLVTTTYTGMTDCYYDSKWGGLVFVSSSATVTNMWLYDLVGLSQVGTYSLAEGYFSIDPSFTYFTTKSSVTVKVYTASSGVTCSNGTYLVISNSSCEACLA
jgi:hypothetical protein